MAENNNHIEKENENLNGNNAEAAIAPESAASLPAEIEALKKQIEEAEARASEYKDGWLRSQAEFQNYKKRIERDNEMMYLSMKGDIIKKVLPVLDDLERALQNRPANDPWADGIELIVRKMQSILEAEGVKRIEAEGAEFDPNFHEAISHEPVDGMSSGRIIEVVQNGYMLGERVIRPALVRVAQ
ncbi:MAG TPA: nucleotide exchange factor GrpE [Anaerolineales bacterium]|nr:nucleotide exchange factor GrpE [Anaerolineales bacterium]